MPGSRDSHNGPVPSPAPAPRSRSTAIPDHGTPNGHQPPRHGVPGNVDLDAIARRIAAKYGFQTDFPADARTQLGALTQPASIPSGVRDLRRLLWSSIDNATSLDLDQAEAAEQLPDGSIRLLVAIADVDALVARGTPLDLHA
ncbi:MAG: RNB domain-containing ribonuclease, partial [Gemmatimonadota bacterium]|nr:RNB domain-containing ribonuclease [Gemmatimonadota bacterium]